MGCFWRLFDSFNPESSYKSFADHRRTVPGADSLMENMFHEGASTKGEGRGLGLSLIHEATRSLKGDISYEFEDGANSA